MKRYGRHDATTAPTTVTVGYGASEHEAPLHPALVAQREALNNFAHSGQPAGKSEGLDDAGPVPPLDSPRRQCIEADEWATFTAALRQAADSDGVVHQSAMRPLLRGRVAPKAIGRCYRRARNEGLLTEVGRERSDDHAGRNAHHWEPYYALRGAA